VPTITSGETRSYTVSSGKALTVDSGGTSSNSLIQSGGVEYVDSGGVSEGDTFASNGRLILHRGALVKDVHIYNGGVLAGPGYVEGGGETEYALVSGVNFVSGNYTFLDTRMVNVSFYDSQYVRIDQGSLSSGLRIHSGGNVSTDNTSTLSGTIIGFGGILSLGGVEPGGEAQATIISKGGILEDDEAVVSGALVHEGGTLSGSGFIPGVLEGQITDFGFVGSFTISSGGVLDVAGRGEGELVEAASGGVISLAGGTTSRDMTTVFGGGMIDEGTAIYTSSFTLGGALSGSGKIVQAHRGVLTQSGDASAFSGEAMINGGAIKLATASDLGTASIAFEATGAASATLEFVAASQPANGATFAETLVDFDGAAEHLDLTKVAYIAGATATLAGATLTLVDGTYSASFTLSGATAAGYVVSSDGHGGTLIAAAPSGARSAALVQALAGFRPAAVVGSPQSAHDAGRKDVLIAVARHQAG
jgi:autotransporter passenger strand-loop-strand repeat protein